MKRYNVGEYQSALDAFNAAYDEYPATLLLFKMAQCQRQLGNRVKAITLYRSYLREQPDAPNKDEVHHLVASLEEELSHEKQSAPPSKPEVDITSTAPVTLNDKKHDAPLSIDSVDRRWWHSRTGMAVGFGGVGLSVIGGALVGGAIGLAHKATNDFTLPSQRADHSTANGLEIAGWVLVGVGVVGIVSGVVVLARHKISTNNSATVR